MRHQTGTIIRRTKGFYYVLTPDKDIVECKIKGKLFKDSRYDNQSAVGDKVSFILDNDLGLINDIFPRTSFLSRNRVGIEAEQVIAANIDNMIITSAIGKPAIRHNLICRMLTAAYVGNIKPIILVTKTDLISKDLLLEALKPYQDTDIEVICSSIIDECDLSNLKKHLLMSTSVLAGQSGVGKSSILNLLFPDLNLKVGAVNKKTAKGSHTTTYASMHEIAESSYVIDTPGIREFGLWDINRDNLCEYFPKIKDYISRCKHRNCRHITEPGCKVKEALKSSDIHPVLYNGYVAIMESL
jgi:ribosome biogenesis GTPase / thiamine phosphate phosphatase